MKCLPTILATLLCGACTIVPPAPERIAPPAAPESADPRQLDALSTGQLLQLLTAHLRQQARLLPTAEANQYADTVLAELHRAHKEDPEALRAVAIQRLRPVRKLTSAELDVPSYPAPPLLGKVVHLLCKVRFDDPAALQRLPSGAKDTSAYWAQHGPAPCQSADGSDCWIYKQHCGPLGHVRYEEYPFGQYGYLHLAFENLDCFDATRGAFGRRRWGGNCTAENIDHSKEPRYAGGHISDHVQRLWVQDDNLPALFTVDRIRVRGNRGDRIRIQFKKQNGAWRAWRSLAPGRYDLSDWAQDIVEMRFQGADGSQSIAQIDDVQVRRLFLSESVSNP